MQCTWSSIKISVSWYYLIPQFTTPHHQPYKHNKYDVSMMKKKEGEYSSLSSSHHDERFSFIVSSSHMR